jgi:hypothetical protein
LGPTFFLPVHTLTDVTKQDSSSYLSFPPRRPVAMSTDLDRRIAEAMAASERALVGMRRGVDALAASVEKVCRWCVECLRRTCVLRS